MDQLVEVSMATITATLVPIKKETQDQQDFSEICFQLETFSSNRVVEEVQAAQLSWLELILIRK